MFIKEKFLEFSRYRKIFTEIYQTQFSVLIMVRYNVQNMYQSNLYCCCRSFLVVAYDIFTLKLFVSVKIIIPRYEIYDFIIQSLFI